jgi:hypothetical protein
MRANLGRYSIFAFVLGGAMACATASGDVTGGGLRAGFDPNALPPAPPQPEVRDSGSGTTWKDLYRDFFGPTGVANCAGTGVCHSVAGKFGVLASNFVCTSVEECYQTIRQGKHPFDKVALVDDATLANPDDAFLFKVVRLQAADGTVAKNRDMPQQPRDFAFTAAELDRIKTWIRNGAKND